MVNHELQQGNHRAEEKEHSLLHSQHLRDFLNTRV